MHRNLRIGVEVHTIKTPRFSNLNRFYWLWKVLMSTLWIKIPVAGLTCNKRWISPWEKRAAEKCILFSLKWVHHHQIEVIMQMRWLNQGLEFTEGRLIRLRCLMDRTVQSLCLLKFLRVFGWFYRFSRQHVQQSGELRLSQFYSVNAINLIRPQKLFGFSCDFSSFTSLFPM